MAVKKSSLDVMSDEEVVTTYDVVDTDNFGGDYPNESFVANFKHEKSAEMFADFYNKKTGDHASRFYKVVRRMEIRYKLQPGLVAALADLPGEDA